jgi:hypothetical protein
MILSKPERVFRFEWILFHIKIIKYLRSEIYDRYYRELEKPNGIEKISLLLVKVPKLVFA